jgi:hypothetical protein
MTVTFETWNKWMAVKIVSGDCEMIIGISAGPRIISLTYCGGKNLLYEDDTNFGVGDWKLYGGHRFTIAPEDEKSYYPDNDACEVVADDLKVVVSAPVRADKLRLSIAISKAVNDTGFNLNHVLENCGAEDWTGALWAITCIPRSAEILASCDTADIHFWSGTDPSNWTCIKGYMRVKPGDFRGKAGWHHQKGKLMARQPDDGSLVIYNPEETASNDCVDEGCNLEVFVCREWVELETLSKRVTVSPGASASHLQHWLLSTDSDLLKLV